MKKRLLIPILLTTTTPMISLVGCGNPDKPDVTIDVNNNMSRIWHLESLPFYLNKDKTYLLNFDMTKLLKPTPAYDTGKRIISFSNGYIPNNITSFIYGDITFTRTDDITELDCDVYKYYVSPESYGYEFGVFFCTTRESIAIPKIQITFECELDSTIETTVELNKTTW